MQERVPAHLEISGLIRAVEAAGGFATVVAKGERDAGTILAICCENGTQARLYERLPQLDGSRNWALVRRQDPDNPQEFIDYYERRTRQDDDLWIVELDIANGKRFLGLSTDAG